MLLANVGLDGTVRFLSSSWERVLGHSLKAKETRPFHELIPCEREAAELIVSMLLDQSNIVPVECNVRSRTGKVRRFLWHRRYEPAEQLMYLAGEEIEVSPPLAGRRLHASARKRAGAASRRAGR